MRHAHGISRLAMVLVIVVLGCSRHEDSDLPMEAAVLTAPAPTGLVVATQDNILYDLSWGIRDASKLSYYRVYNLDPIFGTPSLLQDSVTVTSVQVATAFPTPGIVFGVSSVSVGRVESGITFATAE